MSGAHEQRDSRQVERSKQWSEARYRAILESAVDGIVTCDEAGIIDSANPSAEKMFGYTADELIGCNVNILMPPPYRQEHDGHIARYRETGEKKIIGIEREAVGQRRDGSVFPLDLAISEVFLGDSRSFVGLLRDVTERKDVEEALRRERDFAESLAETARIIVLVLDTEGRIVRFNPYMEKVSGYRLEEVKGKLWFPTFLPERDQKRIGKAFLQAVEALPSSAVTNAIVTKNGDERLIEWHTTTLQDAGGEVAGVLSVGQDITERVHLESQLRQAQKMEAIGRLAGGVAHDFNTLLGSIFGYSEMVLDSLPEDHPQRRAIEQIHRGAERGAALTRQLLAFSRRQVLQPRLLDLNVVITEMREMLRRLTTEDIELVFDLEERIGRVKVDAGQIEQVIMNLIVNSADALPQSGRITLETANLDIDAGHAERGAVLVAGRYVTLSVTDNGCGMDADTKNHAFEPFFTTKEQGKGTGLGLSTVYGIVRQSGGGVSIDSQPGEGTCVKIYLLRSEETAEKAPSESAKDTPDRGSETILLVEDDEMFLELTTEVLESQGYTVLPANTPTEAQAISSRHLEPIHLLVTDMVMPEMTGSVLARRLATERPHLAVLLMSGYSDEILEERSAADSDRAFIQKPFRTKDLARTVRDLLDAVRQ